MTNSYEIRFNDRSNALAGTFEAASEAEALDLFAREEGEENWAAIEAAQPGVREAFKVLAIGASAANPADLLRGGLNNAARVAQQYGATPAQINLIVSLAVQNKNFNIMNGGRLTKADASHIIEELKK